MLIFKIVAVAICSAVGVLALKNVKSEMASLVGICGGIVISLLIIKSLGNVFLNINEILSKTGLSNEIFALLMKVVGIGFLTEFCCGICQDFGSANLSQYVALGGRVVILVLCFPIFKSLLELIVGLVQ